jgi:hypothetical protein
VAASCNEFLASVRSSLNRIHSIELVNNDDNGDNDET